MTRPPHSILAALGALSLLSNCTSIRTINHAPRAKVRFASAKSADTFYQALIRNTTPHNDEDERMLTIGGMMPYSSRRIDSDNVIFNRASKNADTDRNGLISEREAESYSRETDRTAQREPWT